MGTPTKPNPTKTTRTTAARRPQHAYESRSNARKSSTATEITRRYIGLTVLLLIGATALISVWVPAAASVLEKLLPSLTLMLGYYFGQMRD